MLKLRYSGSGRHEGMMQTVDAPEKKPTLEGLHLLRGLCAIAVMLYHYLHEAGVGTFHAVGTYGVYIFFALSGYTITYVYGESKFKKRQVTFFFTSRLFRILPLYIAVATYQLYMLRGVPGIWDKYLLNIFLAFGLATPGATSMVPGGWSIGIEAVFYLLFPVLLTISSIRTLLGLLLLSAVINHVMAAYSYTNNSLSGQWAAYTQAPTFLVYFIGGMFLAQISPNLRERVLKQSVFAPFMLPTLIALLTAMFCLPSIIDIPRQEIIAGIPAKLLIAGSLTTIAVASLLELRPLIKSAAIYLGDISYALYLLHYPVWTRVQMHVEASIGIQALISVCISLILSTIVHKYFERPMRDLKRFIK